MEKSCDLLIRAGWVLTQNETRQVLEDGVVAIAQGRVLETGGPELAAAYTAGRTIHLPRCLLMPGLVNAHTHAAMTFLRGLADDLPLLDWLQRHVFPVEKHLTAEIVELGALLGCAEMVRTGTTAFQDMYLLEDGVCAAVDASGLRARLGEGVFAFPSPAYADPGDALAVVAEQARRWQGHERIRFAVMPHTVYTTTPRILEQCAELAARLDLPVHIHVAESAAETAASLSGPGARPTAVCDAAGLLGPRTTIAHAVDLDDAELALLARRRVGVVHCPRSNMKLASGAARIPRMLELGMLPALGTDGAASNNSLNMFGEMSACALLHKLHTLDPTAAPAQTVLDMATLGGARALHWEGLGALTPGAPADCTALDLTSPNLLPLYTPSSHLVYAACGHEVCLTVVQGRVLYEDGRYTTLDYPLLVREAETLRRWVLQKKERRG